MADLVTLEHSDPDADVLVVTNMWPDAERPYYGIHAARQVRSLIDLGVRCDVLYLRGYRSPLAYVAAALRLAAWSVTRRGRYRLVHAHAGETTLAARFLAGVPQVATYYGDDLLGDPGADGRLTGKSRVRAWLLRQWSRTFTRTITVTQEMEDALPPGRRDRNDVVPHGIDEDLFRPLDREAERARFGWPADEVVALFIATKPDAPGKRRALAEEACARAGAALGRPVRLHIPRGVPDEDVPRLMSAADLLLQPSQLEGSPVAVKEALMCDLPVVACAAGDIPKLLEGVEPSFVCPPDAGALAGAIVACVGRRSNGRAMSAWLRQGEVARRLLAIYERLGAAKVSAL